MVKEVAEDAMKQTGFVYEATSGLYYDYNTGYYYNAVNVIHQLCCVFYFHIVKRGNPCVGAGSLLRW